MTENPYSGRRPYEGSNDPQAGDQLPGERPLDDDEQTQQVPGEPENPSGHSTRAARGGQMSSDQGSGVPGSATAPGSGGPADATAPREAGEDASRG